MVLLLAVLACSKDEVPGGGPSDTSTSDEVVFTGRPVDAASGTCPAFATPGTQDLTSAGVDRQIEAYWPADHEGPIGLMFAWHGLGDRANSFASVLDLQGFADDNDILVVVPYSVNPDLLTWNILEGGDDVALFEDVRDCAAQSFDLDVSRVWSMGFSFGALFTTYLTLHESDILAGTVTFSGGTSETIGMPYFPPVKPIPVLAAWGGDRDQFNAGFVNVDFSATTADFTDNLEADGHVVVRCDHGLGHTIPREWDQILKHFLLAEEFGVTSPYADGDVSDLPDYCE